MYEMKSNWRMQPSVSFLFFLWLLVLWRQRIVVSALLAQPPSLLSPTTRTTKTTISSSSTSCRFTPILRQSPQIFFLSSLCLNDNPKTKEEEEDQVFEDPNDDAEGPLSWDERWDDKIAELIKYNETFGTVNVAYTHWLVGDEYASLACFCDRVRIRQGRLSKERHAQLTSMGFTWDGAKEEKDDQRWEEMYQRLEKYKKNNGHCRVPQRYERDEELGLWVMNQRAFKKKGILKDERIDKLNSVGFAWVVRNGKKRDRPDLEIKWEARRQEFINFHKEKGHYWVLVDYKNKNNPLNPLGRWVHTQRKLYKQGNLRKDRVALLNEIDFTWDSKNKLDKQWDNNFTELNEILSNRTNHEEVYTRKALGDTLYAWVQRQRMLNEKDTLDHNRKELLDGIGFEWIQVKDRD